MKVTEGITEKLKEENQMEWVCCMRNIEITVQKIIVEELICG